MKLATIRLGNDDGAEGTRAVRVDGSTLVDLGARDVREVLERDDWQQSAAAATGQTWDLADADFAPLVPEPSKVICVGLNYRNHILEMGRDLPDHPTLFSKYADTLIGARDEIHRPAETDKLDWEAELTVVIGKPVRRASGADAEAAIGGFTVLNDVTARDWQFRTREWLQGKNWDHTTPVGPFLVTPDELPGGVRPSLSISCEVDGELMQKDSTADLLFDPVALVEYVSTMIRLNPGDLIATGTPGGVGHARKPEVYLSAGQHMVTEIEHIGRLENLVVADPEA